MINIIEELSAKHDMVSILQGLNYVMIKSTMMLDIANLQQGLNPDDELREKYMSTGLCYFAIANSIVEYLYSNDSSIPEDIKEGFEILSYQSDALASYMLITKADIETANATGPISFQSDDDAVRIQVDSDVVDKYAQQVIDTIDDALNEYGVNELMNQCNAMVEQYHVITGFTKLAENDSNSEEENI